MVVGGPKTRCKESSKDRKKCTEVLSKGKFRFICRSTHLFLNHLIGFILV